jgi:prepilin-type N-terminal cleavage/methylation domain-containing protein
MRVVNLKNWRVSPSQADNPMNDKKQSGNPNLQKNKGFSLIELLIVVMIIMILASLAVPSYLGARARANEASAVASIRTLIEAQTLYRSSVGAYTSLNLLNRDYLDDTSIANGLKSGYRFESEAQSGFEKFAFTATAIPQVFVGRSATGRTSYYGDQTNVIRIHPSDDGNAPDNSSPPLQ